jgi:hypothetical protein
MWLVSAYGVAQPGCGMNQYRVRLGSGSGCGKAQFRVQCGSVRVRLGSVQGSAWLS